MPNFPRVFDAVKAMNHLTPLQKERVEVWSTMQRLVCKGCFGPEFDDLFHPNMGYRNPTRPDLTTFKQWKASIVETYSIFNPTLFRTTAALAIDDNEIWVHCYYRANQVREYKSVKAAGQIVDIESFSIVTFDDGLMAGIRTLSDSLGMLISLGVVSPALLPVNSSTGFGAR